MSTPKEIIERIRRTEFLIGVDLSPEAAEGARNMRVNLDHALRTLSEDLYSKDTHFVLELVQNADDNEYQLGVEPELSFSLSSARLIVENNEVGFAERHVVALCRVGQSTKKREKRSGYIGEKGIGFKSVFTATDKPEIHSNGFHFHFDRTDPAFALGYVVPTWCGDPGYPKGRTVIVLPSKEGKHFGTETLGELSEELLLFLRKLRRISIRDDLQQTTRTFSRQDVGDVVTLAVQNQDNGGSQPIVEHRRFKRIQHVYSTANIKEEKRADATEAAIVLAFPLDEHGAPAAEKSHNLFAFLPVRNFGFRFLVQGDFLLSSNREDIHKNSVWNKRARDEIVSAFLTALKAFKEDPVLALSFLHYVPRSGDINEPFFLEVAEGIVDALKNTPCLKSASGSWKTPSEVISADRELEKLFPNDDIKRILGLEYLAEDVQAPAGLLEQLGVKTASVHTHLLNLIGKDATLPQRPVSWLKALYQYCEKKVIGEQALEKFRGLAAVKLESGALLKLADSSVYLPLQATRRYGFEHELPILHPGLLMGEGVDKALEFLTRAGVKKSEPYWLIVHHILPKHASESWKQSGVPALLGHVEYIKDYLDEYLKAAEAAGETPEAAIARISSGIFLQSDKVEGDSTFFSKASQMYLSDAYAPPVRLERMLGDQAEPVRFISKVYLHEEGGKESKDDSGTRRIWREFFYQLGVNRYPLVESIPGGASVDYVPGPELRALFNAEDPKVRKAVLELVDRNWGHYSGFLQAHDAPRRGYQAVRDSQFLHSLRDVKAPSRKRGDYKLSETYLDVEHVRAVFGDSVCYLDANIQNDEFLDVIGVTHRVDAAACIKRLDQLRNVRRANTRTIKTIYRELERLFEKEGTLIENALQEQARIYVPSQTAWFSSEQVVWERSGEFIDRHCPSLETAYREHETFFCRRLHVRRRPSEQALINALTGLGEFGETHVERQGEAIKIYRMLARSLREYQSADDGGEPGWFDALRREEVFLDQTDRLVDASNDLYIGDDQRLAEAFKEHEQISTLAVEQWQLPQLLDMFTLAGIPKLSDVAKFELSAAEGWTVDGEATRQIRKRSPHLMQLLYARAHAAFDRAARGGLWEAAKALEVRVVPVLEVDADVNGHRVRVASDTYRQGTIIYFQANARAKLDKISHELCLFFGLRPDGFSESVYRVLSAPNEEELRDFFEVKGIPDIPGDELAQLLGEDKSETERPDSPETNDSESETDVPLEELSTEEALTTTESAGDGGRSSVSASPDAPWNPTAESVSSGNHGSSLRSAERTPNNSTGRDSSIDGGTATRSTTSRSTTRSSGQRDTERRRSSRLISYAERNAPARENDDEVGHEERLAIAKAAVDFVLELERRAGHDVVEMPFLNEGFDIRRTVADVEEYLEVKGLGGAWGQEGFVMTPPELRMAERTRLRYWLYVVEYARNPDRRKLYKIQDPFGKVDQFRFDAGWKELVAGRPEPLEPREGRRIAIEGVGPGTILSTSRHGMLFRLSVRLDSGEEILNRAFDPSKMTVEEAP